MHMILQKRKRSYPLVRKKGRLHGGDREELYVAQVIAADWEWVHHLQGKRKIQLGRNYIRKSQGIIKASRPGESEWDCLLQVMGGKILNPNNIITY